MSKDLDDLTAAVRRNSDKEDAAITLIRGLAQQIKDNATDPAALRALAAEVNSKADTMAAAIDENTAGSDTGSGDGA